MEHEVTDSPRTNGNGPVIDNDVVTAAWRLTPDLDLQTELDIRAARLQGLARLDDEDNRS